jgi:hypothetical protein
MPIYGHATKKWSRKYVMFSDRPPCWMAPLEEWNTIDYIVKLTFFGVFAFYSPSMRRNQVKSGISRTSTHHRSMRNIWMLKETKSQENNLIFSNTGFDRRNIRADRTSEHSTILCRLRSNCDFSV